MRASSVQEFHGIPRSVKEAGCDKDSEAPLSEAVGTKCNMRLSESDTLGSDPAPPFTSSVPLGGVS